MSANVSYAVMLILMFSLTYVRKSIVCHHSVGLTGTGTHTTHTGANHMLDPDSMTARRRLTHVVDNTLGSHIHIHIQCQRMCALTHVMNIGNTPSPQRNIMTTVNTLFVVNDT